MNIAIIDVGSNNIKLEIHEITPKGTSELIFSEKVSARLGNKVFLTSELSTENVQIAVEGLIYFNSIIKNFDCIKTLAVGTAALREAANQDFLDMVFNKTGIKINVITGVEEARLVYLGSLSKIPFSGRTFFLMDIGGGSTEISVGDRDTLYFIDSLLLGTVRLKDLLENKVMVIDPKKETLTEYYNKIEAYVSEVFLSTSKLISPYAINMGLLTGGTARTLVDLINLYTDKKVKRADGIPVLNTTALENLVEKLKKLSISELELLKGLDKERVDIIMPGAILMLTILKKIGVLNSLVVPYGLRDGVLADYIQKKINPDVYLELQGSFKERGLQIINNKFNTTELQGQHARQCTTLAMKLFEILKHEHRIPDKYSIILYGAALLHDIGSIIDYDSHHKHTKYLILNSTLFGFSKKERLWISLVARYHRKADPKASHKKYSKLKKGQKNVICKLVSLLRIADALDRSYKSIVKEIIVFNVDINMNHITLKVQVDGDSSLEIRSFHKKKKFFEKIFKKTISLIVEPV